MSHFIANIGGVFLYSKQSKQLGEWYNKILKFDHQSWDEDGNFVGKVFNYIDEATGKKAYIVWSISHSKDLSDNPREKTHVINFRVNNLKEVVDHLKSLGETVKEIETHEQGLFAWVTDPDGNIIELWEDTNL